jgi:hypothetical protein
MLFLAQAFESNRHAMGLAVLMELPRRVACPIPNVVMPKVGLRRALTLRARRA